MPENGNDLLRSVAQTGEAYRDGGPHKETGRSPFRERPVVYRETAAGLFYGVTEIRSLIRSKVSFGTTFFATSSPFTR